MKALRRRFRKAVILSVGLSTCLALNANGEAGPEDSSEAGAKQISKRDWPRKKGVVLFKPKQSFQANNLMESSLSSNIGVPGVYELHIEDFMALGGFAPGAQAAQEQSLTEEDMAERLMATGFVEFAEPDYIFTPDALADDPELPSQWFHERIGSPLAWQETVGSAAVKVLVCDTGIESSHPDLKDNVVAGQNFVDGSTHTEPSGNPHGTLVAGVIGAKGNNGIGVAGINWNIQIIPGKISNDKNGGALSSDMAECIQWATDHDIKIVNMSFGGMSSETTLAAAKNLYDKGGMVFASMGNKGLEVDVPNLPYVTMVAGTDRNDWKMYLSNYGVSTDLSAPGVGILSTTTGAQYKITKGTSFSTPIVAGTAALLLSLNPSASAAEVTDVLFETSLDLGQSGMDKNYGHGRIDVQKAVSVYGQRLQLSLKN